MNTDFVGGQTDGFLSWATSPEEDVSRFFLSPLSFPDTCPPESQNPYRTSRSTLFTVELSILMPELFAALHCLFRISLFLPSSAQTSLSLGLLLLRETAILLEGLLGE